ncbi:MAG: glycine zipper 2TM domain-containing protein [Proteobacteria bacterium]|nr:glycine zipper 2TM domain-containing protein [Pseudomonadota bacterium]MBU1739120.1 glycine zipper 2TM domain-containing protein [Pseudomonadota bacterium]
MLQKIKKMHAQVPTTLRRNYFTMLMLATIIFPGFTACMPPSASYAEMEVESVQPPPPSTEVFFYPNRGQSQEQQDRDSYECYLWGVKQTGFDPSAANLAPHHKVVVVPEPPPGTGTAVGAVTGAILGAAVASHHNTAEGALVGAMAGAIFGTAADAARQERSDRIQEYYNRQSGQRFAETERRAEEYRRALSACLEGRGYTVR